MPLRCCKCGQPSSSSSGSSSRSASSLSGSSLSQSSSHQSGSGSGSGGGGGGRECLICNGQIAPAVMEFSWSLANNCPPSPGNPTVGCYTQALGPFDCGNDTENTNAVFSVHGRTLPESVCFWSNNSTGEVEGGLSPYYCGTCAPGPAISIAIGIDDVGQYFIWVVVSFYWLCDPVTTFPDPPAPTQIGSVSLLYEKYSDLPFNCLALNELDLTNATGSFSFPTPGGGVPGGWGPGCNLAFGTAPFGTGFAESSFPLTINIQPAS